MEGMEGIDEEDDNISGPDDEFDQETMNGMEEGMEGDL